MKNNLIGGSGIQGDIMQKLSLNYQVHVADIGLKKGK